MKRGYRAELFASYESTHMAYVEPAEQVQSTWFREYTILNYLPHLSAVDRASAAVLDVGCNRGYLLAALAGLEFRRLTGIDLSPEAVDRARKLVPQAEVLYGDAAEYLQGQPGAFDVIFIKAVLEHMPKAEVLPLLKRARDSLKPGGILVVDVPNMDWIFASHERYMDFTHEIGFTRESLGQLMRNVFGEVTVNGSLPVMAHTARWMLARWLRPAVIRFLTLLFKVIGEGADEVLWYSRSIIAVTRCPTLNQAQDKRQRGRGVG